MKECRIGILTYFIIPTLFVIALLSLVNIVLYQMDIASAKMQEEIEFHAGMDKLQFQVDRAYRTAERIRALYLSSVEVTSEEFNTFSRIISEDFPTETMTLEWVDEDNVVKYVYPDTEDNRKAVNFDNTPYPNRMSPLLLVNERHNPVSSEPIMLLQGYPGILVYIPIFKGEDYIGSAIRVIKMSDIFNTANFESWEDKNIKLVTENMIYLFNKDELYDKNGFKIENATGDKSKSSTDINENGSEHVEAELTIADKTWKIITEPTYKDMIGTKLATYISLNAVLFLLIEGFLIYNLNTQNKLSLMLNTEMSLRQQLEEEIVQRKNYENALNEHNRELQKAKKELEEQRDEIKDLDKNLRGSELKVIELTSDLKRFADKGIIKPVPKRTD